jgi:hypothetical protein
MLWNDARFHVSLPHCARVFKLGRESQESQFRMRFIGRSQIGEVSLTSCTYGGIFEATDYNPPSLVREVHRGRSKDIFPSLVRHLFDRLECIPNICHERWFSSQN